MASQNPDGHEFVLVANEVSDRDPLIVAPRDVQVVMEAPALAAEMALMLENAGVVLFVDGYYDPFNVQYQNTLRECLRVMKTANRCTDCEIHQLDLPDSPTSARIYHGIVQKTLVLVAPSRSFQDAAQSHLPLR